jgi:hypothetical protein
LNPVFGQNKIDQQWERDKSLLDYKRSKTYNGPTDWGGNGPKQMIENEDNFQSTLYYKRISADEVQNQLNQRNKGNEGYEGSASNDWSQNAIEKNTNESPFSNQNQNQKQEESPQSITNNKSVKQTQEPNSKQSPASNSPEIQKNEPDSSLQPNRPSSGGLSFVLKIILIILGSLLLIYLIFKWITNKPKVKPLNENQVEPKNINPIQIPKSELEIKLEAAELEKNYREAVRIYFTFILKELITKKCITWKKEKTNVHFLVEMRSNKNYREFQKCTQIYDATWYGKYSIDETFYRSIRPILSNLYQTLISEPTI